jgi:hypothetical protein
VKRCVTTGVLLAIGLFIAPSAGAATQIGETFGVLSGCGPSTRLQSVSPGNQYAAPFDGVITQWSFLADGSPPSQMKFKAGRAAGGDDFAIVGESQPEPIAAGAMNSFPTRIPVEAGDVIGMYPTTSSDCTATGVSGYTNVFKSFTDVPPMTTTTFSPESNVKNDISALLEADADQDGFGDETQDKCVGTSGSFNGCPNNVVIDGAKQKGKKPKVKMKVTIPGAGTLKAGSANDASLASASASTSLKPVSQTITSTSKQQLTLTLKLTKSAKRKLAEKGKLKVRVKVVYTAPGGPAASRTAKVRLRS